MLTTTMLAQDYLSSICVFSMTDFSIFCKTTLSERSSRDRGLKKSSNFRELKQILTFEATVNTASHESLNLRVQILPLFSYQSLRHTFSIPSNVSKMTRLKNPPQFGNKQSTISFTKKKKFLLKIHNLVLNTKCN